jgi:chemotaxis protein MotB
MPKTAWIFVGISFTLVLLSILGFSYWQQNQQLQELKATFEQNEAQHQRLTNDLAGSKARIDRLLEEKDSVLQAQKGLEQDMRKMLESKDITISQGQGKLLVEILDRVLFDSGQAVLKTEGEQVLQKIAQILAQYPNRQVQIIGHTDNVPIRNRYASNWELSTARATAAVRFLCDSGGVDPRRLGAVGYGEFRPIADNSTEDGRAHNRRIAVVVLSEELAGSDAILAEKMREATNQPKSTITGTLPAGTNQVETPALMVSNSITGNIETNLSNLAAAPNSGTTKSAVAPMANSVTNDPAMRADGPPTTNQAVIHDDPDEP